MGTLVLGGCSTLNLGVPFQVSITKIELPATAQAGAYVNANIVYQYNLQTSGGASFTFLPNEASKTLYATGYIINNSSSMPLSQPATSSQNMPLRFDSAGIWLVQASQSTGIATAEITISGS